MRVIVGRNSDLICADQVHKPAMKNSIQGSSQCKLLLRVFRICEMPGGQSDDNDPALTLGFNSFLSADHAEEPHTSLWTPLIQSITAHTVLDSKPDTGLSGMRGGRMG